MTKPYFWKQTDSRWASYKWKGMSIGGAGCGPTAIACVVSPLVKVVNPKTVFKWICSNGYMAIGQGTYWDGITKGLKHYGIDKFKVSYNASDALKELKKGKWLIGVVRPSRWTSGGHYIVVYGYNAKTGKILVSDPASSRDYHQKNGTWREFARAEKCMWIAINPNDYPKVKARKAKQAIKVTRYVETYAANVRKGRGTNYGVYSTVKRGTKLTLHYYRDGWYRIATGKNKGKYISAKVLTKHPPYKAKYKTNYIMRVREGYSLDAKTKGYIKRGSYITSSHKVGNYIYVPAVKGWVRLRGKKNIYCVKVK